jgi:hypothetical protein
LFGNLGSRNLFEVRELNWGSIGTSGGGIGGKTTSGAKSRISSMKKAYGISSSTPQTYRVDQRGRIIKATGGGGIIGNTTGKQTTDPDAPNYDSGISPHVKKMQQQISDLHGEKTFDAHGNISTVPTTDPSTWSGMKVINILQGNPNEKTAQTLREQVEAKNKATQEFREKWHGIRENGVIISEPTATRTDAVQALLTSNNQHFGTDTRNLEQYLTERDYDISAIIAGDQTVPDDIFKPVKQTEYRDISKQITEKLDKISNYEKAKGKNSAQRNISYGGVKGHEYFTLKEEVEILQGVLESKSTNIPTQTLKEQDEQTILNIVDGTTTTPQNVSRSERGVPDAQKTIIQTTPFNLLPIIFIAVVGLIGIYLIRRKK